MADTPPDLDTSVAAASPPAEGARHRGLIGLIAMCAGLVGLIGLYVIPVPKENHDAVMLALGIVLGWGSTVVGYEFGSSPSGRAAAQAGLRKPEDPS